MPWSVPELGLRYRTRLQASTVQILHLRITPIFFHMLGPPNTKCSHAIGKCFFTVILTSRSFPAFLHFNPGFASHIMPFLKTSRSAAGGPWRPFIVTRAVTYMSACTRNTQLKVGNFWSKLAESQPRQQRLASLECCCLFTASFTSLGHPLLINLVHKLETALPTYIRTKSETSKLETKEQCICCGEPHIASSIQWCQT